MLNSNLIFLKNSFFRKFITFIRLFFYVKILKSVKSLSSNSKNISPLSIESNLRVLIPNNNLPSYSKLSYFLGIGTNVAGYKSNMLLAVIDSIYSATFINKNSIDLLIIGPRTEGEIFLCQSFGYLKDKIDAIDLFSYSPLIRLGDMHDIPAKDSSYNLVLCGWVLAYSDNKKLAISEIIRVCKDQAYICIGASYLAKSSHEQFLERGYIIGSSDKFYNSDDILTFFDGYNYDIVYNVNSVKTLKHSQILLIIKINKC